MKYISLLCSLIIMASSVLAQTATEKIDALLSHIENHDQNMGSLAVLKGGEVIYARAIGYNDVEENIPAKANSRYRVGSITKTYTATMIMQMIEQGKLTLETTLDQFFDEVPNSDKITIAQLLGHRSGLYNLTNKEDYMEWNTAAQFQNQLIDRIIENGTVFEPGARTEYSNTNYILLTWIIESIDNGPYSRSLLERITGPHGLEQTTYGHPIRPENNDAHSYERLKSWKKSSETHMSVPLGAGAIVSTAEDVARFYRLLLTGEIISVESVDRMKQLEEGMGLGIFRFPFNDKWAYGHTGGIDAFQSMAGYFIDEDIAVVYLANGVKYANNDIMIGVLSYLFDKEFELPEFSELVDVPAEQLAKYLGTYSTEGFPLKLTFTTEEGVLMAQATGQPAFPLDAKSTTLFTFDAAGVELVFVEDGTKVTLRQNGMEWTLAKE